jgi:hypothetical protein
MKKLFAAIVFCLSPAVLLGQQHSLSLPSLYEVVLSRVFKYEHTNQSQLMILRYLYCRSGEMQIIVHYTNSVPSSFEVWDLPKGSLPIWQRLTSAKRQDLLNIEKTAEQIHVEHRSQSLIDHSSLNNTIAESGSLVIPLVGSEGFGSDHCQYNLTFDSQEKSVSVRFRRSSSARDIQSPPFIQWMEKMRTQVEISTMH